MTNNSQPRDMAAQLHERRGNHDYEAVTFGQHLRQSDAGVYVRIVCLPSRVLPDLTPFFAPDGRPTLEPARNSILKNAEFWLSS